VYSTALEKHKNAYVKEIESKKTDSQQFLSQSIDGDTLAAYTKWKYPDLPLNREVHELLIRDLDRNRFKTLGDIDRAISAASDAVECYKKEMPALFESGTAFITKSLGFVDEGFRNRHPFSGKTREAFRKYALPQ
jgi:putative GTP pyrophosphokinase